MHVACLFVRLPVLCCYWGVDFLVDGNQLSFSCGSGDRERELNKRSALCHAEYSVFSWLVDDVLGSMQQVATMDDDQGIMQSTTTEVNIHSVWHPVQEVHCHSLLKTHRLF